MRPLDGITVVSLEHAIAAPFATRQLADLGARVIKIERPGTGDFARAYDKRVHGLASHFVWTNRSKESLTLDLKHPQALAVLQRLVWRAPTCWCRTSHPAPRLAWACLMQRCRQPIRADRVRHLRLRRRRSVPRQEGLRPADPERGRLPVGDRQPRRAGQGRHLDRRHRRRHVRVQQHPVGADPARPHRRGREIDVSMLESLVEWMGYPLYYAFDGAAPPPRTGACPRHHLSLRAVPGRRRRHRHAGAAERARMGPVLREGAAAAAACDRRALFQQRPGAAPRAPNCADHRGHFRRPLGAAGGRAARCRADRQRPRQRHARGLGAPAAQGAPALGRGRDRGGHHSRAAAAWHHPRRPAAHGRRARARDSTATRSSPSWACRRRRSRRCAKPARSEPEDRHGSCASTYLFVPGNRPERFDKALASGADAIILDLEDAVAAEHKSAARDSISAWLATPRASDCPVLVRINDASTRWFDDDLAWLVRHTSRRGDAAEMPRTRPSSHPTHCEPAGANRGRRADRIGTAVWPTPGRSRRRLACSACAFGTLDYAPRPRPAGRRAAASSTRGSVASPPGRSVDAGKPRWTQAVMRTGRVTAGDRLRSSRPSPNPIRACCTRRSRSCASMAADGCDGGRPRALHRPGRSSGSCCPRRSA